MRFLVGGRFACVRCLRRSAHRTCLRCDDDLDVVDLETESGRRRLALRRTAGPSVVRRRWFDLATFHALAPGQQMLWAGSRLAFVVGFVGALASHMMPAPRVFLDWITRTVIATMMGFTAFGALLITVSMAVLATLGAAGVLAQGLGLVGGAVQLVGRVLPGRGGRWLTAGGTEITALGQDAILQRTLDLVERTFVAQVRLEDHLPVTTPARVRGVLRGDGELVAVSAARGAMELRDAWAAPFDLETDDGEHIRVEIESGVLDCVDLDRLEPATVPMTPSWIDPGSLRARGGMSRRVPVGTRMLVEGGAFEEELDPAGTHAGFRHAATRRVLRGTEASPIRLRVFGTGAGR